MRSDPWAATSPPHSASLLVDPPATGTITDDYPVGSPTPGPGCCTETGGGHWIRGSKPGGSPPSSPAHPQVRETVHTLATQDARSTGSLPHFAAWCGIRI